MGRKPGSTAAGGHRDIRSFFGAAPAAAKIPGALKSSQNTSDSPVTLSSSSATGLYSPDGDVPAYPAPGPSPEESKRLRPSVAQDEKSEPATENQDDSYAAGELPRASEHPSASISSSGLHSTPTVPASALQSLLRTPGRSSAMAPSVEGNADPSNPLSGRATGSARKVRFSSEPTTPGHSADPEQTTPRRLLFTQATKAASESPPASPIAVLPNLSASKKRKGPLGTPKRIKDATPSDTPSSLPSLPDLPSSPSLPPSPSTTRKRSALAMDAVIKGSDDEDDDDSFSDCSLPGLDMLGPSKPKTDPCRTPKAKRRARMVHKSPLTIQPKHKFDFKTLDAHSKRHDVTFDSPERVKDPRIKDELMEDVGASPSKARQTLIEIAGVKTEEDADKALRAMERTDAGSRTRWYFFKKDAEPSQVPAAFPKNSASGPWSFLQKPGTRDRHIMSGMPTSLAASLGLPDELYIWVLGMVNVEEVSVLREEYCRLAAANEKQVRRLVTPQRLAEVFRQLGAADHVGDETLHPVREVRDVYAERDWKALQSCLEWLHNIARYLEHDSIVFSIKMLLRMAADKMVLENPDVLMVHQYALAALVENVQDRVWNEFCTEICSSLYHGFDKSSLRILPLLCIPITSERLHELRRRLAIAFFLKDAASANQHPDSSMKLRLVIARVKDRDFQLTRKTDYADLKAQVQLLDMAVDDGSFVPNSEDREHEKSFNAEVDDLAKRLKAIWRGINDTGAANLARTEAKSVLEWVGQRLTYSVRTRPPPTQSIFGDQGPSSAKKKRQQDFMLKFVHSKKNKVVQEDITEDTSSGEDDTFVTACG